MSGDLLSAERSDTSLALPAPAPPRSRPGLREMTYRLLCLFWFTIPWEGALRLGGTSTIAKGIGVLMAVSALAAVSLGRIRHRLTDFTVLTMAFAVWVATSVVWSLAPDLTRVRALTMLQLAVMVLIVWEFAHTRRRLMGLMTAFVLGCAFSAVIVVFAFLLGARSARYAAAGTSPGDIANTLAYGIPLAWYLALRARDRRVALLLRLYLPLAIFAVILTASRAAALSLPLVLLIVPAYWRYLSRRTQLLVAVVTSVLLALVLSLAAALSGPLARLGTASSEISSGTLDHRTTLWRLALGYINDRPWLGLGAGSSRVANSNYYREAGVHNTYLSVSSELGGVGLVLFLLILVAVLWAALRRTRPLERRLAWTMAAILLYGLLPRHAEYNKDTWAMLCMLALLGALMSATPTVRGGFSLTSVSPAWPAPERSDGTSGMHADRPSEVVSSGRAPTGAAPPPPVREQHVPQS